MKIHTTPLKAKQIFGLALAASVILISCGKGEQKSTTADQVVKATIATAGKSKNRESV